MTPEQKQQAIALVKAWGKTAYGMHADAMAALLQELVDAPEAEPFGYFKAEPFGWTDCAETDDGAIALFAAAPAPSVPNVLPVHETPEMHDAVMSELRKGITRMDTDRPWQAYRKALAATPTPPEPPQAARNLAKVKGRHHLEALK